jgi:hypothetical protein
LWIPECPVMSCAFAIADVKTNNAVRALRFPL